MQSVEQIKALGFSENQSLIINRLLENGTIREENFNRNDLSVDLSQYEYCEIFVTLKNAVINTEINFENSVCYEELNLSKSGNGYILQGRALKFNYDSDEDIELIIEFDDLKIDVKTLKTQFDLSFAENPWENLTYFASCIYEKVITPYLTESRKEKELEPLLKELNYLNVYTNDFQKCVRFDKLKDFLPKSEKIENLFKKIENCRNENQYFKRAKKLFDALWDKRYENSFRQLLTLLEQSQLEYKEREIKTPKGLEEEHQRIDNAMKDRGYSGEYPYYKKQAKITGLHLKKSRDEIYLTGNKTASIFVKCADNILDDQGNIRFSVCTLLDKDVYSDLDEYSCLFAQKGKAFFTDEIITYEINGDEKIDFLQDNKIITDIVCKRAEFKKLTKEERNLSLNAKTKYSIIASLLTCLVLGVLFGVIMTICFIAVEFFAALFTGLINQFVPLFLSTPWWAVFLFCWLTFSTVTSVIAILAD